MTEPKPAETAQDSLFTESAVKLDLKDFFQNLWRSNKKALRVNRRLKEAFEELLERHRLYEILKVERGPAGARLTLANLWRLTRIAGGNLILHSFDLQSGQWREDDPETITWLEEEGRFLGSNSLENLWPFMEIHFQKTHYKNLFSAWLEKILFRLQDMKTGPDDRELPQIWRSEARVLVDYLFRRLIQLPSREPAQVIDSALQRHIWDREFLALFFPLRFFPSRGHNEVRLSLGRYLAGQGHREGLARIRRETPNLMPLLNLVDPAAWSRPDLWQDRVLRASGPIFSLMSAGALRWLRRAPALVLDYFRHFMENALKERRRYSEMNLPALAGETVEVLAGLPPRAASQPKTAELLIDAVWNLLLKFNQTVTPDAPRLAARLARLLARHILAVQAKAGPGGAGSPDLSRPGARDDFGVESVSDWFQAEGWAQGLPDKNSTWQSLKRRSEQWHREVWQREYGRHFCGGVRFGGGFRDGPDRLRLWRSAELLENEGNPAWESLVGLLEIEGIKIKPLVTPLDLFNEGREMRHCVVSYAPRCVNEGYRIFSLTEPNGKRSTLSLRPSSAGGLVLDQHKGPANGPVSPAAARAAREICRLYTRAAETAQDAFGMAEPPHSPEEAKPAATEGAAK